MKRIRLTSSLFLLLCTLTESQEQDCPIECYHNGKCELHKGTGLFHCLCPSLEDDSSGFQGIHCEESYVQCTDGEQKSWRCHNNGKCNPDKLGCDCPAEFDDSKFCETYSGPCSAEKGDFLLGLECSSARTGMNTSSSLLRKEHHKLSGGEIFGIFILSSFGAVLFFISGMKLERWNMHHRDNPGKSAASDGQDAHLPKIEIT